MHFKLFCYAARPACMSVCILVSVRMEISSLICKVYMFTKAEENYGEMLCSLLASKEYTKTCGKWCTRCMHPMFSFK